MICSTMLRTQYSLLLCLCLFVIATLFTYVLQRPCSNCLLFTRRTYDPDKTLVLVLTYLRSGSTLTGDILQQSLKSFYMYEPLRSYKSNIFLDGQICNTFSMNCSKHSTENILTVIEDLFRCRLQQHKLRVLLPRKNSVAVMSVIPFCKSRPGFDTCMKKLQTVCYQSQSIILKTIRLSMDLMPILLNKFPGLKVVHLLRDPRGLRTPEDVAGFSEIPESRKVPRVYVH